MLVIGLTGGIASGKSTVAKLFAEKGIAIIDTDIIARDITKPGQEALKAIVTEFGHEILLPDQTLDRKKLRKIVFANPQKRRWLEQLLHPLIRKNMEEQIHQATSPYCIAVIPLLVETLPTPILNRVLVVDASAHQQLTRVLERDNITLEDAESIIGSQVSRDERLAIADDYIINDDGMRNLREQVDKLHTLYLSLVNPNPSVVINK